jgi:hypothetical protein
MVDGVVFQKVSQEEDREALSTALAAAEDWLYDEGDSTTLAVYKAKLAELKAIADVIFVPLYVYRNPTPVATPPPSNATDAAASNSTEPATEATDADADEVSACMHVVALVLSPSVWGVAPLPIEKPRAKRAGAAVTHAL